MRNTIKALGMELAYCASRARLLRRNLSAPPTQRIYPCMVQIQTLNRCNGACVMCPYSATVALQDERSMEEELFEQILAELATWEQGGLLALTFQNEPFLDPRLEAFISRARSTLGLKWVLEVTTNGTLVDPTRVARLAASPPDLINVSLNALTQETYTRVMPGLSWERVGRHLEAMIDARLPVALRYIALRQNVAEYGRFRRRWHRRGLPVMGYESNDRIGAVPDHDTLTPHERPLLLKFVRRAMTPVVSGRCVFPFSQIDILASGDLLMCCNDYTGESRIGNVREAGLLEAFNSRPYREARASSRRGQPYGICARCSLYRQSVAVRG